MESPREAANRKCPYCRAETLPPRDSTLGGPPGARWRKGQSVPRSATPTSMTQPCPPQSSAARLFGVHCRPRPAPPRALLGTAQPVRPGPDENSTPGTSRCTSSRGRGGGGSGNDSRRAWGASLNSRFAPSRARRVLGATSKPFRSAGNTSRGFRRGHPLPGRHYTPQEKLLTPHRAALPSVRRPPGAHKPPSHAQGKTPLAAPIHHGTKMSGRVTGQPPPRPTPGACRTRCLRAREPRRGSGQGARMPGSAGWGRRRSTRDSPSARPPQRRGEGWVGEDTIWQSTTAALGRFQ